MHNRSFSLLALTLSAQLALIVFSATTSSSVARATSVAAKGDVSLSHSNYSVADSAGSITLTAQRFGGTQGALSVSYRTIDETAVAGAQFTAATGTLTWANGDGADKSITIPISNSETFTGIKYFGVQLNAGPGTKLGSHTSATVNIVGGASSTSTKSIRDFVSCDEEVDESAQLEQALLSAANNAFTLVIDCPVRFHTGTEARRSIAVPEGVTLSFQGAGEFLVADNGVPALTIADPEQKPSDANFLDWNITDL